MEEEFEETDSYDGVFEEKTSSKEKNSFKIEPAKESSLKEITGREKRIAVVGTLVSINKKEMQGLFSDGSSDCSIVFTESEMMPGLKAGIIVRVIGKPSKKPRLSIEAEIVQELKGFDANLYKKVRELEKKQFGGKE
ncbi:MAG: hypothetical protein QXK06_01150 [Candidatus Diapherotrites archaeon]